MCEITSNCQNLVGGDQQIIEESFYVLFFTTILLDLFPPTSVRNAFGNYFQVSNKRTIPQLLKEVGEYPFYILKRQFEVVSSHSGSFGGLLKSF